jgi:thymidylate kinase
MSLVIFFEGVDCVGKTTIMQAFNKITNYKYLCFDRGVVSYLAYADIYKRKIDYPQIMSNSASCFLVAYISCDDLIIKRRIWKTGHEMFDIQQHKKAFEKALWLVHSAGMRIVRCEYQRSKPESIANKIHKRVMMER